MNVEAGQVMLKGLVNTKTSQLFAKEERTVGTGILQENEEASQKSCYGHFNFYKCVKYTSHYVKDKSLRAGKEDMVELRTPGSA